MLFKLLLALHMIGLAVGATGGISHGQIVQKLAKTGSDVSQVLWDLERLATRASRIGLTFMLITGAWMLWLKYGGASDQSWIFWLKMLAVATLIGADIVRDVSTRRWKDGDDTQAPRAALAGGIGGIAAVAAVVAAAFNFG